MALIAAAVTLVLGYTLVYKGWQDWSDHPISFLDALTGKGAGATAGGGSARGGGSQAGQPFEQVTPILPGAVIAKVNPQGQQALTNAWNDLKRLLGFS